MLVVEDTQSSGHARGHNRGGHTESGGDGFDAGRVL